LQECVPRNLKYIGGFREWVIKMPVCGCDSQNNLDIAVDSERGAPTPTVSEWDRQNK
jgi:hypothetical protein